MNRQPNPSFELRLRVLAAVDHQTGSTIRERIKRAAELDYTDPRTGQVFRFTWRTLSTWLYRYKIAGVATLEPKTRSDKHRCRKVQVDQLAEAIHELLPKLGRNKQGKLPKSLLYRELIERGYFRRAQLAPTTFYRRLRENDLLESEVIEKLRQAFAMQHANELWQADTMHGPTIKLADGSWQKTFLIAFIDDASRLITHAEVFSRDNTPNMISAFRSALYKRGKPERLYFDNGSNYTSQEILKACVRLNIQLCHAPVRDGAAKGKIERFFRTLRDQCLSAYPAFESLDSLNTIVQDWIEHTYNERVHSAIQMPPIERFMLDRSRITFLANDQFTEEAFFVEVGRKVNATNLVSLNRRTLECPVDLRGKRVQLRYDRNRCDRVIVYYNDTRCGEARPLDAVHNSHGIRKRSTGAPTAGADQ